MKYLVAAVLLSLSLSAFAHGGGLDSYGCHRNNKVGNYHCHRGDDAGKTFASKEAYVLYRNRKTK